MTLDSLLAVLAALMLVAAGHGSLAGIATVRSGTSQDRREIIVTRAVDGSSLDARVDGNRTALGYLGVETPPANQPCGREALERNRELAGARVLVQEDPRYQLDERGRRLFYAYTIDGVSIDETLVREGLGLAVRTDAQLGAQLAQAQAEAEAAGRGCLWGRPGLRPAAAGEPARGRMFSRS